MQLPILSDLRRLSSGPRRFLAFSGCNVASWQCIVGPAMILFARSIDMPASWVGVMLSFLSFAMLLVAFTLPLVTRLGPKKLMWSAWFLRNVLVCGIFSMPWVMSWWGQEAAWILLMGSTLGFCIIRAIGVGGWFPWLHEVVPEKERGTFFSTELALVHFLNVIIISAQGLWLRDNSSQTAFLCIYGIGVTAGFTSLIGMARIPGGRGHPASQDGASSFAAYAIALRDRRYMRFILLACICFMGLSWWNTSYIMFLRDVMHYTDRTNMLITATGCAALLLSIKAWGRFAEHSGSGKAIYKSLLAFSLMVLLFLLYERESTFAFPAIWVTVIFISIFVGAFWSAIHRAMLNFVQEEGRIGYTNIWLLFFAVSQGVTAIMAGQLIEHFQVLGFRLCFLFAGILGLVGAFSAEKIIGDSAPETHPKNWIMNPALPIRTFARIVWITAGMHESNRDK